MAKRFTETKIWDDQWFQDLPTKYKLFWKYLCDKCGIAGDWAVNMSLAQFQLGVKITLSEALRLYNTGKKRVLDCGNIWLLLQFVDFQYGKLNPDKVRFHKTVQDRIDSLSRRVSNSLQDKDKDKEEEIIGQGDNKDQEEEDKTWRNDLTIYQAQARAAMNELLNDNEWLKGRETFHPNLNISLSLQKAWGDYWTTEAGWINKKSKRTKEIDWKATANNSLSQKCNQVWISKNTERVKHEYEREAAGKYDNL